MARLRDDAPALAGLVARTSESTGIQPGWIEKDFWVTEVIRSVSQTPIDNGILILKGGTSLLKAFRLIERMSEDVDVLLAYSEKPGRSPRERDLKAVHSDVVSHLEFDQEAQTDKEGGQAGTRRDIRYTYPGAKAEGGLTAGVLLELGVRGGPTPRKGASFRSIIADHGLVAGLVTLDEYDELDEVTIQTLAPVRTLVEKLSALHHLGMTLPESAHKMSLSGRHLYDIAMLLGSPDIQQQLDIPGTTVTELAVDVERVSEDSGWAFSPRPADGFGASPIFAPASESAEALEKAYEDARDLIFGLSIPTFQDCLKSVGDSAQLI